MTMALIGYESVDELSNDILTFNDSATLKENKPSKKCKS